MSRMIHAGVLLTALLLNACGSDAKSSDGNLLSAGAAGGATGGAPGTGGAGGNGGADEQGGAGGEGGFAGTPEGLGESCPSGCSASFCGGPNTECRTGYCLWDSRYVRDSYCTVPCAGAGAACPAGYECVQDAVEDALFFCGKVKPEPPSDFGTPCDARFDSALDCSYYTFDCAVSSQACASEQCAKDIAADQAYCTMPCNPGALPCPDGYDCKQNPGFYADPQYICLKQSTSQDRLGAPCHLGVLSCE